MRLPRLRKIAYLIADHVFAQPHSEILKERAAGKINISTLPNQTMQSLCHHSVAAKRVLVSSSKAKRKITPSDAHFSVPDWSRVSSSVAASQSDACLHRRSSILFLSYYRVFAPLHFTAVWPKQNERSSRKRPSCLSCKIVYYGLFPTVIPGNLILASHSKPLVRHQPS